MPLPLPLLVPVLGIFLALFMMASTRILSLHFGLSCVFIDLERTYFHHPMGEAWRGSFWGQQPFDLDELSFLCHWRSCIAMRPRVPTLGHLVSTSLFFFGSQGCIMRTNGANVGGSSSVGSSIVTLLVLILICLLFLLLF